MSTNPFEPLVEAIAEAVVAKLQAAQRPDLMTIRQAHERTGIPIRTLQAMVARGDIPRAPMTGRRLMVRRVDVERLSASQ